MSKKMITGVAIAAILFLVSSCSSPLKVTSDYDKAVNFANYKTFSVYNLKVKGSVSQLNADRIVNAIHNEMIKKGFTPASDSASADLLVNAVTILKDKQQISANTNYYGYGGMYRPYGYYGGMGMSGNTTVTTYEYKEGTFIIDVVDNKTQKMIWEGVGSKDIDSKPKNPEEVINNGVNKIMADFPPGATKK
jgi:hypothetical protein